MGLFWLKTTEDSGFYIEGLTRLIIQISQYYPFFIKTYTNIKHYLC